MLDCVVSIMKERDSAIPSARTASNCIYVRSLTACAQGQDAGNLANASSARKTAITTRVLQLVSELCAKGIHVTKRDLFYPGVKLFNQTESDDILDDAACMLGCTQSLNVVASEKGIVVGQLIFEDDGDTIDCTKMGVGGKPIRRRSTALPTSVETPSSSSLSRRMPRSCASPRTASITPTVCYHLRQGSAGHNDAPLSQQGSRIAQHPWPFRRRPLWAQILSVYMKGSKNMSYDAMNLTTPDIKWQRAAVRPRQVPDPTAVPAGDVGA